MRIIDKNNDFYDYISYANYDDSIVFDRTDSFELTKTELINSLVIHKDDYPWWSKKFSPDNCNINKFILLQVCNRFWLFVVKVTKFNDYGMQFPKEYTISLLSTWTNYNKPRKLVTLDEISFSGIHFDYFKDDVYKRKSDLVREVNNNNYKFKYNFCHGTVIKSYRTGYSKDERHIPLLKSSGLSDLINPVDIYTAFEEYFSTEKTLNERRESVGLTDKERIENHGFDLKTSFRGKN